MRSLVNFKRQLNMSAYSVENIQTLSWHEHIRKRPGMYLGVINPKAFLELIKNICSEVQSKTTLKSVQITQKKDLNAIVLIEHEKYHFNKETTELIWKPNPQFSIAFPILNALSKRFEFCLLNQAKELKFQQYFEQGILQTESPDSENIPGNFIKIDFELDKSIWGDQFDWNSDFFINGMRTYAFLQKAVRFEINSEADSDKCKSIFQFKNGLSDRLELEKWEGLGGTYFDTHLVEKFNECPIEMAFAFREYSVDEAYLQSFVNDAYTPENGTHVEGLLKGLTYGAMKYFQKHNLVNRYKISEKGMQENLIAFVNIRMVAPIYTGCVKNKLGNTEIIEPIAEMVSNVLFEKMEADEKATAALIRKFEIY